MTRLGPRSWFDDAQESLEAQDYLLLAATLALPWAFGGVEIWAYRGSSMLIAWAAAIGLARHGWAGLGLDRTSRWLLPAFLLGGWAVLQIVPLPPALIAAVSPTADSIYRATYPGYGAEAPADMLGAIETLALGQVPEADGHGAPPRTEGFFGTTIAGDWTGWRTISLLPAASVERLLWYFSLLIAFLLVRQRVADPDRADIYRRLLFGGLVALGMFGLVYATTSNGKLYWIRATRQETNPIGPYVNPVNFAAVMELAVPWLAGYAWGVARELGGGWRAVIRSPIFAAGATICAAAAVAAASKAAAALIGLSLLALFLILARSARVRIAGLAVAIVLVAGAVFLLQNSRLGERMQQLVDASGGNLASIDRVVIIDAALPMIRDFPITGSGFGSFREVFGRYLPEGEFLIWNQLHNDYLEVLTDGGVIAGLLLVWLIVAYWSRVLRPSALTDEGSVAPERVGLALGLLALTVHATVDFNHQIPANGLLFVVLAAFLVTLGDTARGVPVTTVEEFE